MIPRMKGSRLMHVLSLVGLGIGILMLDSPAPVPPVEPNRSTVIIHDTLMVAAHMSVQHIPGMPFRG
jgi:hypothetical protein